MRIKMEVEFSVLRRQYQRYEKEWEEAGLRVMRSGQYILGEEVRKFENEFAKYLGVRHCVGVGNGLDALRLALEGLGIGAGDEVIVPANTFIATALAVSETGAKPVFVDVDLYFGICASEIERAVTKNTKAVMVVHLYGQPCDMDSIMEVSRKHNLYVVEDCAQSHGAYYRGCLTGTFGDVACFSFYPTKPIGALGDAGAVVTNQLDVAERVRMLRNYGSQKKYQHELLGYNSRMDEIQAAFLQVALRHEREGANERQKIAAMYLKEIKNDKMILPQLREGTEHVFHIFPIFPAQGFGREEICKYFKAHGVYTQIHYPIPCHLEECYKDLSYHVGDIPYAEYCAASEISLPMYIGMTIEEAEYVIQVANDFPR